MAIYIDQKKRGCNYEACILLHLQISNLKFGHNEQLTAAHYVDMALSIDTVYHQCQFFNL